MKPTMLIKCPKCNHHLFRIENEAGKLIAICDARIVPTDSRELWYRPCDGRIDLTEVIRG